MVLDPKLTVEGPDEITVSLVRADFHSTSNIFRLFFEVCLTFASSLAGVVSSIEKPTRIHWVFLGVMCVGAVTFALLSFWYHRKSGK